MSHICKVSGNRQELPCINCTCESSGSISESFACGILADVGVGIPTDPHGCLLPEGHEGPHEFEDSNGVRWRWETDWECDCDHCMAANGDYCSTYRQVSDGQASNDA